MSDEHSTSHIIQSLLVNVAIAVAKLVAAVFTGSGAMLAEAIHSFSDCANQLLLLVGLRKAKRAPDHSHPLGYGREVYFWSFMVAMLLFSGGGVFSIYEGVHRILHPEPIEHVSIALAILGFSLILEGGSALSNIKELNKRRKTVPFFRFLRETKDSDLIVVFGENAAASLGLTFALITTVLASSTGDGRYDGLGSLLVGLVLVGVSVFLAREVKSLLVGESADPSVVRAVEEAVSDHKRIDRLLKIITIQQGPGEIMVAAKVHLAKGLTGEDVVDAINELERELHRRCPDVRWCFIEPDDQE